MRVENDSWLTTRPIAHRGLHNEDLPENTMGAFENAVLHDYPIEIDIRLTKDGRVVVFHDEDLTRATGGKNTEQISAMDYAQLKTVRIFDSEFNVPLLTELLEFIGGRVPLLIEYKNNQMNNNTLEECASKILDEYKHEYAVQSFNPYVLNWYKKNRPDVIRGQLVTSYLGEGFVKNVRSYFLKRMITNSVSKPDFISYNVDNIPNKYVDREVKRRKIPVICWTVRNDEQLAHARKYCKNIIFENISI